MNSCQNMSMPMSTLMPAHMPMGISIWRMPTSISICIHAYEHFCLRLRARMCGYRQMDRHVYRHATVVFTDMCADMRTDMCADMCTDMCTDICTDMCTYIWTDTCTDMFTDMCPDTCPNMCADMCADMCSEM